MRLDNIEQLPTISSKASFAIFEAPAEDFAKILPKAYHIKPNEKGIITIDEIRAISDITQTKQQSDLTIVAEDAETMNAAAANAFLKNLEEPGDHIHYIFLVRNLSKILPTIKSRAHCYYLPAIDKIANKPNIDPDIIAIAKRYISATPQQLPKLATEIAKDKKDARGKAIAVVDASIQLLYKSYFVTGNLTFTKRLGQLLKASDALKANGNIKLQLVAGML